MRKTENVPLWYVKGVLCENVHLKIVSLLYITDGDSKLLRLQKPQLLLQLHRSHDLGWAKLVSVGQLCSRDLVSQNFCQISLAP